MTSNRRVVDPPCYNEYIHANVTETIKNDGYVGGGGQNLGWVTTVLF